MNSDLKSFIEKYKAKLESELALEVTKLNAPSSLKEAMNYSLQAGGKRIRPILLFATLQSFGKDPLDGLKAALALEMIHTYSLIHDDLPSMDDDDLRRGRPTNHKVYGEAIAILAGDGLLTYSFQQLSQMKLINLEARMNLIELFAKAAGPEGMVGGQTSDMLGEGRALSLEELESIHVRKTGRLLACGVRAGAILSQANEGQLDLLDTYAHHLGLAFQIQDDILDIEGNQALMGKPLGSDIVNDKSTYPALLTLSGAKKKLSYHLNEAKTALLKAGFNTTLLMEIVDVIGTRDH
jgi:geranylgeranyl diphosphate synthase type II